MATTFLFQCLCISAFHVKDLDISSAYDSIERHLIKDELENLPRKKEYFACGPKVVEACLVSQLGVTKDQSKEFFFGARMDFADSVKEFFALPLHGEELRIASETIVIFLRLREA